MVFTTPRARFLAWLFPLRKRTKALPRLVKGRTQADSSTGAASRRRRFGKFLTRKPRCEVDRGLHSARVRGAFAGPIVRGAVVDTRSNDGKPERDIHRVAEASQLHRDRRLVVVHRDD